MDRGLGTEIRRLYDRRARVYDPLVRALSLGRDGRYRDRAVRELDVRPGDRVLDVGCGTGLNLARLPGAVGIDPSGGLLRIARRRSRRLAQSRAEDLPFPDASFDRALCTYVVTTIPDWPRALAEIARVLRPGGRLVLTDDRLPPGWFLGPGPMWRRLRRDGWVDLLPRVLGELGRRFAGLRTEFLHLRLIYLVSGVRAGDGG